MAIQQTRPLVMEICAKGRSDIFDGWGGGGGGGGGGDGEGGRGAGFRRARSFDRQKVVLVCGM